MKLVESNTHQYAPDLQVALSDNSFGSDHVSFQRAGIPAILGIELDDTNYPHYHRVTDTVRCLRVGVGCVIPLVTMYYWPLISSHMRARISKHSLLVSQMHRFFTHPQVRETTPKQALDIVKGMAAALVDLAGVD